MSTNSVLYELRETDGVYDHWVADVNVDLDRGVAETYDGGVFERLTGFYDLVEVVSWACRIYGISQYSGFLLDPVSDDDYIVDCSGMFAVA